MFDTKIYELYSIIEYRMSLPWSDVHQKKYSLFYDYLVTLDEYKDKQLKQDNYLLKFLKEEPNQANQK